jgi:hypothetical protein
MNVRESASRVRGILIRYRHATGKEELLELQVSNVPALMKALADIRTR